MHALGHDVAGQGGHFRGGRDPVVDRVALRVLGGVVVLYAVQALYSTDVEAATKDLAFFYVPFAVLLRLLLDAPWSKRLVVAVLGTVVGLALIFALVGLYQYATRTTLLANEKVLLAKELKPYFRVNSLLFDPNIYGRFLAIAMVLLTAAMLWARERRLVLWSVLAVPLYLAVMYFWPTAYFFALTPLDTSHWVTVVLLAAAALVPCVLIGWRLRRGRPS